MKKVMKLIITDRNEGEKMVNFIRHINSSVFKFKDINLQKGDAVFPMPGCKIKKRELDKTLAENYPGVFRVRDITKATKILLPNYCNRTAVDSKSTYWTWRKEYVDLNGNVKDKHDIQKDVFIDNYDLLSKLGFSSFDLKIKKLINSNLAKQKFTFTPQYAKLEGQLEYLFKNRHKVFHENSIRRITTNHIVSLKESMEGMGLDSLVLMLEQGQEDNAEIALSILKSMDPRKALYKIIASYINKKMNQDTRKRVYKEVFYRFPDLQAIVPRWNSLYSYYCDFNQFKGIKKFVDYFKKNEIEFTYKDVIKDFFKIDVDKNVVYNGDRQIDTIPVALYTLMSYRDNNEVNLKKFYQSIVNETENGDTTRMVVQQPDVADPVVLDSV